MDQESRRGNVGFVIFRIDEIKGLQASVDHTWGWIVHKEGRIIAAGSEVCSSICQEIAFERAEREGMEDRCGAG